MKLNTKLLFAAPIVLLILGAAKSAYAWDYGPEPGNWGGYGPWSDGGLGHLLGQLGLGDYGGGGEGNGWYHQNGYQAGVVDAQNDYQSNLVYSPHPSYCCHS